MLNPAQVRQTYMQIPMLLRKKLADAIDEQFVGPFLKTLVAQELAPLVDEISRATPDQVQPGPNDVDAEAPMDDARMAAAMQVA